MALRCINCRSDVDPARDACSVCGDAITHFLREHASDLIDSKYRVISRLGIGGMGEVYKVLHEHLHALRAVKMMRPNLSKDQGAQDRFVREARLATRIGHPNVATLYDFSTLSDGCCYTVWEHIDGMTLANHLRARGTLPPLHVTRLAMAMLSGLEAIHRCGIVHRDISPQNIMITRDENAPDRVKIIDLGIAKEWADSESDKTNSGVFVGKWKYSSPEQLGTLGPDERIDNRSDLYSLGTVMYEMLTGQPPFVADSPLRYVYLHATQRPRPFSAVVPDLTIPESLEAVVMRALDKNRDTRFASARDFRDALEKVVSLLPADPNIADHDTVDSEIVPVADLTMPPLSLEQPIDPAAEDSGRTLGTSGTTPAAAQIPKEKLPEGVGFPQEDTYRQDLSEATPAPNVVIGHRERTGTVEAEMSSAAAVAVTIADTVRPTIPDLVSPMQHLGLDQRPRDLSVRTLADEPVIIDRPLASPWRWRMAAAAGVLLILSVLLWLATTARRQESETKTPSRIPTASAPGDPALPMVHARLSIWVYPWARVVRITNRDTGSRIDTHDGTTPFVIDIPAGRYEIALRNDDLNQGLVKHVNLKVNEWHRLRLSMLPANPETLPEFHETR